MTPELRAALIDALDTLDTYLMANWDMHVRRRVRERFDAVRTLLIKEGGA